MDEAKNAGAAAANWANVWASFRSSRIGSRPPTGTPLHDRFAQVVAACGGSTGSVFLLEPGGRWLRAALGIWDWTRTSFRVWLEHWPNVSLALAQDRALRLDLGLADGAESDWFERNGIQSCIAAPMVGRRGPVGVLFVDFVRAGHVDFARSLGFAHDAAKGWAHAIEGAADAGGAVGAEPSALPPDTPVRAIMTPAPVLIGADSRVHAAIRLAKTRGVHHLLAVEGGRVRGVVCRCELDAARPNAQVSQLMRAPAVSVATETTIAEATQIVRDRTVGCLPVTDVSGQVVGVVTRRDLRRAGALGLEPGFDACASCASTHGLVPPRGLAPVFCSECTTSPSASPSSVEALYQTLGGSE